MEILKTLAVALSLGSLAGLNLYLTVFVSGLALRFDWVSLPAPLHGLEVLAHPIVIVLAGILYLFEFFADKIPWIDTAWDSVHTFIRPLGAAALAVAAMGEVNPVFEVTAALLAGSMALSSHLAKAGTRLVANTSPEPFTNIGLSLAEDGIVLGGLSLIAWSPLVALGIATVVFIAIIAILPMLLRSIRRHLWFAWRKLKCPADDKKPEAPETALPARWDTLLRRSHSNKNAVDWALPCVTGKGTLLPPNIHGWLVRLDGDSLEIQFIGRTWRGSTFATIDCRDATVTSHPGFMADRISITHRDGAPRQIFDIDRLHSKAAQFALETLHGSIESNDTLE
jgi:hypothetical protein